jgi:hypothetical protein
MTIQPFRDGIYEATITPDEARAIAGRTVSTNNNFRTPLGGSGQYDRPTQIYADAMSTGRWNWTDASPIRLHYATDGALVCSDGLHRLYACSVSDVPLQTIVMVGVMYVAGTETDRGKNRTFPELLKHHGLDKNVNVVAGATRLLQTNAVCIHRDISPVHAQKFLHAEDLLQLWRNHSGRLEMMASISSRFRRFNLPIAGTTAAMAVLPDDVTQEIIAAFDDPDNQPIGSPWTAAIRTAQNHYSRAGRPISTPVGFDLMCRCYDAYLSGSTPMHFKLAHRRKPGFPVGVDYRDYLPTSMGADAAAARVFAAITNSIS